MYSSLSFAQSQKERTRKIGGNNVSFFLERRRATPVHNQYVRVRPEEGKVQENWSFHVKMITFRTFKTFMVNLNVKSHSFDT